jgi:hypothetical protein
MIIRAIFWIALVAFLMPHEPDLGFGRPGAHATKAPGAGMFASAQSLVLRNLEQVRADLAANGHGLHHGI